MKSILMTAFALFFTIAFANAQTKDTSSTRMHSYSKTTTTGSSSTLPKDYVTMKSGKVMENNDGNWTTLSGTFTCSDGSSVSSSGTLTKKDGTTKMLKDGDKVYKNGHCSMSKMGTKPKSSDNNNSPQ